MPDRCELFKGGFSIVVGAWGIADEDLECFVFALRFKQADLVGDNDVKGVGLCGIGGDLFAIPLLAFYLKTISPCGEIL